MDALHVSFLLSLVGLCGSLRYATDIEVQELHQTVSMFLSKGQLTLETLPLLSLWARSTLPQWLLACIGATSWAAISTLIVGRYAQQFSRSHLFLFLFTTLSYCSALQLYTSIGGHQRDSMEDCCRVSEFITALVLLLTTSPDAGASSSKALQSGLLQCLLLFSWSLGGNLSDFISSSVVVYLAFTANILGRTKDHGLGSEAVVIFQITANTALSLLQPFLWFALLLGAVFPNSEIAAGGNYNLRFLSPEARRALSPLGKEDTISPNSGNHTIPQHAIVPYVPVSLYLPQAGFLWQDDSVWLPHLGVFGADWELSDSHQNHPAGKDVEEFPTQEAPLYRAYYSDPIARRHPWLFEQDSPPDDTKTDLHDDYITSHLWSGEVVHVRSLVTHHYLGVAGDQKSVIDQEMGIEYDDESFARLQVGGQKERSLNTTWRIEYSPGLDNGFRLFNLVQGCYLASSFRSYPDWDGDLGNDTVSTHIHQLVEATCTRAASKQASTLFVIEGTRRPVNNSAAGWLAPPAYMRDIFIRGYRIMRGVLSLHNMRRLYGDALDVPQILLNRDAKASATTQAFEFIILMLFILAHIGRLCRQQRSVGKMVQSTVIRPPRLPKCRPLISQITTSSILVYSHCLAYYAIGAARPCGGRLVLLFAILGLYEMGYSS